MERRKKKFVNGLVTVIALISVNCLAWQVLGSDRERMHLLGKVKSVVAWQYGAKGMGDNPVRAKQLAGNADDYNYSSFDSLGRLKEEASFAKENTLLRLKRYKYDKNDSISQVLSYSPDTHLIEKVEYKRDSKQRVTEIRYTNGKGKTIKSYLQKYVDAPADGMKTMEWIARDEFDSLDKYISRPRKIFFYDANGNVVKVDDYTFANPVTVKFATTSSYTYDKNSHLIKFIHYFANDSVQERISYSWYPDSKLKSTTDEEYYFNRQLRKSVTDDYDSLGNISAQTNFEIEKNKTLSSADTWTFEYEYDDKGNWIRKISFLRSSPAMITERKIEYYK